METKNDARGLEQDPPQTRIKCADGSLAETTLQAHVRLHDGPNDDRSSARTKKRFPMADGTPKIGTRRSKRHDEESEAHHSGAYAQDAHHMRRLENESTSALGMVDGIPTRRYSAHARGDYKEKECLCLLSRCKAARVEIGPKRQKARSQGLLLSDSADTELESDPFTAVQMVGGQIDSVTNRCRSRIPFNSHWGDEDIKRGGAKRAGDPRANTAYSWQRTTTSPKLSEPLPIALDGIEKTAQSEFGSPSTSSIIQGVHVTKDVVDNWKKVENILLDTKVEESEDNCQVVLHPGGSTSWPAFLLRSGAGQIKMIRPCVSCKATLAPISTHRLSIEKIVEHLVITEEDEILLHLIKRFILAEIPDTPLTECTSTCERKSYFEFDENVVEEENCETKISRNFNKDDIAILKEAQLIRRGQSTSAMSCFKVPKKDNSARFIMDCRPLNRKYKDERYTMELDPLEMVIQAALRYSVVISTDANAYFFQFRLSREASLRFPMKLCTLRGNFQTYFMTALPMGFKFAPAIAQRTSNIIIRQVRRWMESRNTEGAVFAWIDNFLVFASDRVTADAIMVELLKWLSYFHIESKPIDRSNSFLGLQRVTKGVKLADDFVEKANEKFGTFSEAKDPSFNDFLLIAGTVLWANITIMRRPLCFTPSFLDAIRAASRDLSEQMPSDMLLKVREELKWWWDRLEATLLRIDVHHDHSRLAWSDATPSSGAVVIEKDKSEDVVFAVTFPCDVQIFDAEMAMAVFAALVTGAPTQLRIDNTAVAHAIAKGHSNTKKGNAMLRLLFDEGAPSEVGWIPTNLQRADGPTRGKMPLPRHNAPVALIRSYFTGSAKLFIEEEEERAGVFPNKDSVLQQFK